METDSFFYRLLKQLPETLFELVGLPVRRARAYRFDSVELKKSLRIDAKRPGLPLYFVEVQFQQVSTFYANLFSKVFAYLEENDPAQEWMAVAIFANRRVEPAERGPYDALLESARVKRIYLDGHKMPADPPPGLAILQMVTAPLAQVKDLAAKIVTRPTGSESDAKVIELLEELLIRRFSQLSREEVRAMFHLEDLRKTRVWQEAHEEGTAKGIERGIERGIEQGIEQGIEKGKVLARQEMVHNCLAQGLSAKEIAELLKIPVQEVRRLARR